MKIEVRDLRPNPFRKLDRYPVQPEKVAALMRSIKDTSFWDNLIVRKAPDGDGFEIGYGHNRLEALKKLRIEEVDLPVRKLDDTMMAKIMAHENMEEWGSSATIEQETVRAIVEGYGNGRIIGLAPAKGRKDEMRYAPSFSVGRDLNTTSGSSYPYTVSTLKDFLGWKDYKVESALDALALVEEGAASEDEFVGLSSRQAREVGAQTKRVLKQTGSMEKARGVADALSKGMRRTDGRLSPRQFKNVEPVTIHNAREVANRVSGLDRKPLPPPKKLPPLGKFAETVAIMLGRVFYTHGDKIRAIIEHRAHLDDEDRAMLVGALHRLAEKATMFADQLESETTTTRNLADKLITVEEART